MKVKKILEDLGTLINAKNKKVVKKKKKIKSLLAQLKEEKRALKAKLETESDQDKARQLRRKLKIIKSERRKGIKMLKKAMIKHQEKNSASSDNT